MKFKYLTILNNEIFWGKNELTRGDLVGLREGKYDIILDLENGTYFNAAENKWEEIKGDLLVKEREE